MAKENTGATQLSDFLRMIVRITEKGEAEENSGAAELSDFFSKTASKAEESKTEENADAAQLSGFLKMIARIAEKGEARKNIGAANPTDFFDKNACKAENDEAREKFVEERLSDFLSMVSRKTEKGEAVMELPIRQSLLNPMGSLHGGTIISLADSTAGNGTVASLPPGSYGFTTVELKSNFLGTAREGTLDCVAKAVHLGKTTQVWDAVVTHRETGKTLALFRCTQLILYR